MIVLCSSRPFSPYILVLSGCWRCLSFIRQIKNTKAFSLPLFPACFLSIFFAPRLSFSPPSDCPDLCLLFYLSQACFFSSCIESFPPSLSLIVLFAVRGVAIFHCAFLLNPPTQSCKPVEVMCDRAFVFRLRLKNVLPSVQALIRC